MFINLVFERLFFHVWYYRITLNIYTTKQELIVLLQC